MGWGEGLEIRSSVVFLFTELILTEHFTNPTDHPRAVVVVVVVSNAEAAASTKVAASVEVNTPESFGFHASAAFRLANSN